MAILRSIAAVLAGIFTVVALSVGTDLALQNSVLPAMNSAQAAPPLLALALSYRTLFGVLGGYVTARLAPSRPMTHATVLGGLGTLAAVGGVVAMWQWGNHWYSIALAVLALPQTLLGALLAMRKGATPPPITR